MADMGGHHPTEVTEEKLQKYFDTTLEARAKLTVVTPHPSWFERAAQDFLRMCDSYVNDAKSFHAQGDRVLAFACLNYAHGWLDAGARLGFWDVQGDDRLFTLLE